MTPPEPVAALASRAHRVAPFPDRPRGSSPRPTDDVSRPGVAPARPARPALTIAPRLALADTDFDFDADWLAGLGPSTSVTYRAALADFASWAGCSVREAVAAILQHDRPVAVRFVRRYRAALLSRHLAPATINVRLATLRGLVGAARAIGVVEWTLDVPGVAAEPYRDTRGPGLSGARAILAAAGESRGARRLRDVLLVRLLIDLGLRRSEAANITMDDLALDENGRPFALLVLGKGRRQRARIALPPETREALERWLRHRDVSSPRLLGLTPRGLAKAIGRLSARAGLGSSTTAHSLRHVSVTLALDVTSGDARRVRGHSRHANIATVMRYDDARHDGSIARLVASLLSENGASPRRRGVTSP